MAARGGDDVWCEIRRRRVPDDDLVPADIFEQPADAGPATAAPETRHALPAAMPEVEFAVMTGGQGAPSSQKAAEAQPIVPKVAPQEARPAASMSPPIIAPRPASAYQAAERHAGFAPPGAFEAPTPAQARASFDETQTTEAPSITASGETGAAAERIASAAPRALTPDPEPSALESRQFIPRPGPLATERTPPPDSPTSVPEPPAPAPPVPAPAPVPRASEPVVQTPAPNVAAPEPLVSATEPVAASATAWKPPVVPTPPVERPSPVPPVRATAPPAAAAPSTPRPVSDRIVPPEVILPPPMLPSPTAEGAPMGRDSSRLQSPPPGRPQFGGLERLLRLVATRGASTLYLSSQSQPSMRVEGEVYPVEGEGVLAPNDVEALLLSVMPEPDHEALRAGAAADWTSEVTGVGRVRCTTFRDHRGPGGVFRIMPGRVASAEQLGLPRRVQALAIEPEGLLLVTGPRLSGKRTLISAFVDLINRTRRDHVITVEREISVIHPRINAFISQREARGGFDDMLAVAQAALREDPDILVIESLRTPSLVGVALEAASAGRLVIGGFPAHATTSAIDRIINACPPEHRRQLQQSLAETLRGVVAQVLVRRVGGGRLAAREVLLNTPAVAAAISEGKTSQLPIAIDGGRRYGMASMNDSLAGLVQKGSVDPREAYRAAADRMGLLAAFERLGLDTSFVERRA